jgi:hypothetical protein
MLVSSQLGQGWERLRLPRPTPLAVPSAFSWPLRGQIQLPAREKMSIRWMEHQIGITK